MVHRRPSFRSKPFRDLGDLLVRNNVQLPAVCLPEVPDRPLTAEEERCLFAEAMVDVTPLSGRAKVVASVRRQTPTKSRQRADPDDESIRALKRMIETGDGFVLEYTAEYVQGSVKWLPPEMFRRIHGGHFSIQDHVDLHRCNLWAAKALFDEFMDRVTSAGLQTVLVVHGRGRRSPGPPVIKQNLLRWLVKGRWKRWVIAFTSARGCDGGTGATVVLLRRHPVSGRGNLSLKTGKETR